MPHKMNTRSCERVNGLAVVLRGNLTMLGELAGDQWNEGDVSDSVVRRVALPDAFFAADGLFETFLTVLDEFGAFPAVVARELDRYLPFLGHHQGPDARRAPGRRPRERPRGDQGARGRGGAGHARAGG
jgi:adenylosuccinate lyase